MTSPHDTDPGDASPRAIVTAGGCLYFALLTAGLAWLVWRERLAALPERAVGEFGVPVAAVAGLAVGLAGAAVFAVGVRRLPAVAPIVAEARRIFEPMGESAILVLVLLGAVAEEVFFRLAVQDRFGLTGSVAAYGLMSMCAMGWRWLPFALLHALALGALVRLGFGLLASATANAVMNYLCLRRMLNT